MMVVWLVEMMAQQKVDWKVDKRVEKKDVQ